MFTPFCLFSPAGCLQPRSLAPIQGLDLGLEYRTSEMLLAAPAEPRLRTGLSLAKPFMSCLHFISQEPQRFFSTEMVFLEPVSKAAFRGTADAATAQARPRPEAPCAPPLASHLLSKAKRLATPAHWNLVTQSLQSCPQCDLIDL